MKPYNLMDLNIEETKGLVTELGQPAYRAKQIYKWVHQKGILSISEMTDLPLDLRDQLEKVSTPGHLRVSASQKSADGTTKYLFTLSDENAIESVFLPHDYGNSVCVSSQVGCRMGCRFCASTIGGRVRNLSAGEIYAQVMRIQSHTQQRISSVVMMGSGEPLENLDQVLKFIAMITSVDGLNIGARHITISTCGLVPEIGQLARQKLQITLSVSLHAPNNKIRDLIMPVNKKYPVEELLKACRDYVTLTNRRITFEYALIRNLNDEQEHARELASLVKGLLCHINLIPLNQVNERDFVKSPPSKVVVFKEILEKSGVSVTLRKEMGADIDAACGQLRRRAAEGHLVQDGGK